MTNLKYKSYEVPGTAFKVRGLIYKSVKTPGLVPLGLSPVSSPLVGDYRKFISDHLRSTQWYTVCMDLLQDSETIATTVLGKFAYSPFMYYNIESFMDHHIQPEILNFVDESANR